jgi:hypothetical protein
MEMHLGGDFQNVFPKTQLFIRHRPEKQPLQGAKGAAGVILLPKIANHWKIGKSKIL